jgi:defect-in-organelle-trafficking protein DotC
MSRSLFKASAAVVAMGILAGCTQNQQQPVVSATPAKARADINPDYRAGVALNVSDKPTPSLDELVNVKPTGAVVPTDPNDKLRFPAMRDSALAYGARGGLAFSSRQINQTLQQKADHLSKIYDFSRLMILGPDGTQVLPPVISEAKKTYETQEAGKSLRVADSFYEIIQQARFAPVAPLWHSYLLREYTPPTPPPDEILPKSDGERDMWRRWITEGWMKGVAQAEAIFQADLNRLERDYTGMVRYRQLLAEGKVSAPVVAKGDFGVTGTGNDMRVNDRALRITRDPLLNTDPSKWSAAVSNVTPTEAATPPGKAPTVPVEPRRATRLLNRDTTQSTDPNLTTQNPSDSAGSTQSNSGVRFDSSKPATRTY